MNELLIEDLLQNTDFQESQYLDFYQMRIDWERAQILFELQDEINSI
jgi:hypothetical protein